MTKKNNEKRDFSKKITGWVGSTPSLIVHTIFFIGIFSLRLFGFDTESILLILTTVVSLEAIYLSIFIQITINQHSEDLEEVSEDIEELQEDVDEISEDVDEIQKDVEEISEDVEEIQKDVDEIQEDVEEISEDDELELKAEEIAEQEEKHKFDEIEKTLKTLIQEISELKKK